MMNRYTQSGATLVEVLIAFAILSFSLLSLLHFESRFTHNSNVSEQRAQAILLGQQKLEELRNKMHTNTSNASLPVDVQSGEHSEIINHTELNTNTHYRIDWKVIDDTSRDYKTINLVVSWQDRNGTAYEVKLDTMIANFNINDVYNIYR